MNDTEFLYLIKHYIEYLRGYRCDASEYGEPVTQELERRINEISITGNTPAQQVLELGATQEYLCDIAPAPSML